jgi:hypothetical protein
MKMQVSYMPQKMAKMFCKTSTVSMLVLSLGVLAAGLAEAPSLELLEFLGHWESAEGEWQDPLELLQTLDVTDVDVAAVDAQITDGEENDNAQ